jgi:Icc protein
LTDFHFLAESGQRMLGLDTEQTFADVLEAALASGPAPDLALLTGDLVQDPAASAYQRLKARLAALPCPAYCLPGNHDDPRLIEDHLTGGNVFFQPSVLLDHWQIVCLDSTIPRQPYGRLGEEQLRLLETLLAAQPQRHALVALHHHPVSTGSAWMDTMLLEDAEPFFSLLERHGQAKGVVFGHVHQAVDRLHRGFRVLATPSTCFQFKPLQADFALDELPPGFRWIELHPDGAIATSFGRLPEMPAGLDFSSRGY